MFSLRTCWGLLAVGVLALAPLAARAGDDTVRLGLPGGPAAADADTRTLTMTPADDAATTLVFHHHCGYGGCCFRGCFGGCCGWRLGCCLPRCGYYGGPAYYSAPIVAYSAPAYAYSAPAYAYSYAAPRYVAPAAYAYSAPVAPSFGIRVANAGVSVNLADRSVKMDLPSFGSTTLSAAPSFRVAPTAPEVRETLPTPRQAYPTPAAVPTPADATFPYDGGPALPVPMPREVVPAPAAPAAPAPGSPSLRVVGGKPAAAKYVYPAFGEQPRRETKPAGDKVVGDDTAPNRRVSR
jgi:hypothetical protein